MKHIDFTSPAETFPPVAAFGDFSLPANVKRREQGFTMLEMLIAVVVFLVIMGAVFQMLRLATTERNTVDARVDSAKSARIAVNYMRRDILNAGLSYHNVGGNVPDNWANLRFNAPADSDVGEITTRDLLTSIVASNNTNTNSLNPLSPTDAITVVSRDLTFNGGSLLNFTSTAASGNDVLVKISGGTAACQLYDVYLFETDTSQIVGMVTKIEDATTIRIGFGDPLGVNQSATGINDAKNLLIGTNVTGTIKKINIVNYSVAAGTLIRRSFGNLPLGGATGQIETHELIYDVQDLQIKYLMDDGTVSDDPSNGNNGRLNQQKMNQVIDVEINLKVLEPATTQQIVTAPLSIKEIISTRNLRYTIG